MTAPALAFAPPLAFIALSVFVWIDAERYSVLGSVFPRTMAVAMAICSVLILIRSLVRFRKEVSAPPIEDSRSRGSIWRPVALIVIFALWLFAMNEIGFVVSSAVAFIALTLVSERERFAPVRLLLIIVVGLLGIAGVVALMSNVLMVPLPRGILF